MKCSSEVASKRRAVFCGSLYGFVVSYARGVALVHEGSLRQGSKPDETDDTHQSKSLKGGTGEAKPPENARAKPPEEKTTEDKLTNSKTHERG